MICPTKESLSESLGTLNFAGRMANLEIHLAKTETVDDMFDKKTQIDFYKNNEIDDSQFIKELKIKNEIIENQKTRIESLENMIINLFKQIKNKKHEEIFLLEKQLFNIKMGKNVIENVNKTKTSLDDINIEDEFFKEYLND